MDNIGKYTIGKKSRLYTGNSTGYGWFTKYNDALLFAKYKDNPVGYDVYILTVKGLVEV